MIAANPPKMKPNLDSSVGSGLNLFRTKRGDPVSRHSLQKYFRDKALKLGLIQAKTPP